MSWLKKYQKHVDKNLKKAIDKLGQLMYNNFCVTLRDAMIAYW